MENLKINVHEWDKLDEPRREQLCRRVEAEIPAEVMDAVREVIEAVQREGDAALIRYTEKFDRVDLKGASLRVSEEEIRRAEEDLPNQLKEAIRFAAENVRRVHESQRPGALELSEVRPGVFVGERSRAIPSVGLYVPHGRGRFPSVMYMQGIPAGVAGVRRIAAISPPDEEGRVDPACLFAARICGIGEVYRVGGIQGIVALAVGTESVPRVDKILGPGSLYVAAAKRALAHRVDVGLPAGPSEAIVLADESADPARAALDLITEAEHGSDSSAFLVTHHRALAAAVEQALPGLLASLHTQRAAFVADVLSGFGGIVITGTLEQSIEFVNRYAPEHLQIACRDPMFLLERIENAGEILLGQNSAFSMANYAAGCNNVIPTGGWTRTSSPLSVRDFLKSSSVLYVGAQGVPALGDPVATLAAYEGFSAHELAVRRRGPQAGGDGTVSSPPAR
ncbi:MAG: histidinol dehydrogenase [Spirochaetales bacterium]|nr:histidinol dehydrogenase [Spirochaetales bacterium]